jgi:hypothetical protein
MQRERFGRNGPDDHPGTSTGALRACLVVSLDALMPKEDLALYAEQWVALRHDASDRHAVPSIPTPLAARQMEVLTTDMLMPVPPRGSSDLLILSTKPGWLARGR